MPYKSKEQRRIKYQQNKEKINRKRRERAKIPEIREKIRANNKKWRENNREKLTINILSMPNLNNFYYLLIKDKNNSIISNS